MLFAPVRRLQRTNPPQRKEEDRFARGGFPAARFSHFANAWQNSTGGSISFSRRLPILGDFPLSLPKIGKTPEMPRKSPKGNRTPRLLDSAPCGTPAPREAVPDSRFSPFRFPVSHTFPVELLRTGRRRGWGGFFMDSARCRKPAARRCGARYRLSSPFRPQGREPAEFFRYSKGGCWSPRPRVPCGPFPLPPPGPASFRTCFMRGPRRRFPLSGAHAPCITQTFKTTTGPKGHPQHGTKPIPTKTSQQNQLNPAETPNNPHRTNLQT